MYIKLIGHKTYFLEVDHIILRRFKNTMKANTKRFHLYEEPKPHVRECDAESCNNEGTFRAPRSRNNLHEYYWFCLEHVREYNLQWNYYAGMSEDEIEFSRRTDTTWQRPTWPLGERYNFYIDDERNFDVASLLGKHQRKGAKHDENGQWFSPQSEESKALSLLSLEMPITIEEVKKRYKHLAKEYHPDRHGGCKHAEEKLKSVNQAYSVLKKAL